MVTRKKRKPLSPPTEFEKIIPVFERVPREDALKRQLDTAISLWFHERNTLAIHVIAMAAYDCLCDLAGKKVDVSTDVYEWLKHASSDPNERIKFSASDNRKVIWNATMLFLQVFSWRSARMRTFDLYYLLHPSGLIARHVDPNVEAFMPKTLSVHDVSNLGRVDFFLTVSASFLAENADKIPAEESVSDLFLEPPDF